MRTQARCLVAACFPLIVWCVGAAAQSSPEVQLPGAPPLPPALQQQLRQAWKEQSGSARPNTSKLNSDGSPKYINRLVLSHSPYLQQHAFNPVNWYPWGDEAFEAAKRENKPVFLSIGYASCHWCHVMEHECFDDEAIAKALNENYIAIKVDREERPDVDAVYIAAVQRMTGSAGWPLSVFVTADRQPFYGGTYFPPEDLGGRPGFPKLLKTLKSAWDTNHDSVVEASAEITKALRDAANVSAGGALDETVLRRAAAHLATLFDSVNGGFGKPPKFPQTHVLRFLCRYTYRSGDTAAQNMAFLTLDHMTRGGINDLIGGGFHRYSTDAEWRVPHYEKMLYDQALDAQAYLEAMRASDGKNFRVEPREIFTYVLRDMTSPEGAFYAAEDADSAGGEGRFYTWTRSEIVSALGQEDGALFTDLFGMSSGDVPQPLTLTMPANDFLKQRKINAQQFVKTMAKMRVALMTERNKRPRPARDDKIITAWNGLMIAALADGAKTLTDDKLSAAAARAADFILTHLQQEGRLLRIYRGSAAAGRGYLDDYAYLILGLHELYEATFEPRWLLEANRLSNEMIRLFDDPATGALRYSAADQEKLIAPGNDLEDQALPAPQSVAAYELLRLGRLTMNKSFEDRGRALLALNGADVERAPTAYAFRLLALDFALGPSQEIVLAGKRDDPKLKGLATTLRNLYTPRAVVALHDPDDKQVEQLVPFLSQQKMVSGTATVYVCENYVCKLPTSDPDKLRSIVTAMRDSQLKASPSSVAGTNPPVAP